MPHCGETLVLNIGVVDPKLRPATVISVVNMGAGEWYGIVDLILLEADLPLAAGVKAWSEDKVAGIRVQVTPDSHGDKIGQWTYVTER